MATVKGYIQVNISELKSGMKIDFGIYYRQQGEFTLLCKDVVLTDEMLNRFLRITEPRNEVFIPDNRYVEIFGVEPPKEPEPEKEKIKKETPKPKEQKKPQVKLPANPPVNFSGYKEVKENTSKFFDDIAKNDRISPELTDAIAETVFAQVNGIDVSLIMQSINSIRKVDEYLYTHSVNVALLNGLIGRWLEFDKHKLDNLVKIGILHDIGKLKIPPEVLNKPGKLTNKEFEIIKKHPLYSFKILADSGVKEKQILFGVLQHHEKVNGKGYPQGLPASEITEFARITAISDIYDAMVAKRVYKEAHSPFEILDWFSKGCYSDLDIFYVNTFLDCMVKELQGKNVVLSDGSVATVTYVYSSNFMYPIVQQGERTFNTTPELFCVSMYNGEI